MLAYPLFGDCWSNSIDHSYDGIFTIWIYYGFDYGNNPHIGFWNNNLLLYPTVTGVSKNTPCVSGIFSWDMWNGFDYISNGAGSVK